MALACLLSLLSTPLAGYLALGSLEWFYPPMEIDPAASDTIVVLGGTMTIDDDKEAEARVGPSSYYRCLHAAHLYERAGKCQIIVTGGKIDWSTPGPTLAQVMRDFLIEIGVDPEDIAVEAQATTTYENAKFSKEILAKESKGRVVLITDAFHMHRAERCFRSLGVAVVPAPCSRRAQKLDRKLNSILPSTHGMQGVEIAFHEWLGVLWYWGRGI